MRWSHSLPLLLALAACSSPPKPPTVDESRKRPVNTAQAIELQACRGELRNTRLLAGENARAAEASGATVARLAQQRQAPAAEPVVEARNTVYTLLFAFGSSQVSITEADAARMLDEARSAPMVLLRGRTDGDSESAAESRIARERAAAVQAYLIRGGVDPVRIRSTWQPVGDFAADNTLAGGRNLNRRVEIEIYRAAPRVAALGPASAM